MSVAGLLNRTATVAHRAPGAANVYGDKPLATTSTETLACAIQQETASDITVGTDRTLERWRIFLPPTTVIDANDEVTIDGVVYQIAGPSWPVDNHRSGGVHHVEAVLVRTT